MPHAKTIPVVLNVGSGLDEKAKIPDLVRKVMAAAGLEADIRMPERGADLQELTRELVRGGAETVVAAGGDGTVNAVASVLAGSGVALGVIPVGTLNHFARDLGIPLNAEGAARVVCEGKTVQVDVGEVDGRRFINNAILGLYPFYRSQRERGERRGLGKWAAMSRAVFSVLRRNPALTVTVEIEGQTLTRRTPFVMVANNRHEMEGYQLGSREKLNEGMLYLYVMHRMSRLGLLRLGVSVVLGRFSKGRDFDLLRACEVKVESRRKTLGVSLDGEVARMAPPLCFKSCPGTLRVIVPAAFADRH